jgi:hypothetical protein
MAQATLSHPTGASMRIYKQDRCSKKTMNDDFDPYDPDDISETSVEPLALSKDEIHRELVRTWFDCLRLNEDYDTYCEAKRNGDPVTCQHLEHKHRRIAELFIDWGDIFDGVSYSEWIAKRNHLFFISEPIVKWGDTSHGSPGSAVPITIPVGLSKPELNRLLKDFVADNEDRLCRAPKYRVNGQITQAKLLTLARGATAYDLHNSNIEPDEDYRNRPGMQEYSYTNVARSFLGNAVMYRDHGLGSDGDIWSSPPSIPEGEDTWSYDDLQPYREAVGKWIVYYEKCIESTIEGMFPAKT